VAFSPERFVVVPLTLVEQSPMPSFFHATVSALSAVISHNPSISARLFLHALSTVYFGQIRSRPFTSRPHIPLPTSLQLPYAGVILAFGMP